MHAGRRWSQAAMAVVLAGTVTGYICAADGQDMDLFGNPLASLPLDCDPGSLPPAQAQRCQALRQNEGRRLFEHETFGGNGRTCATCHSAETGTISPEDVQARLAANSNDELFRHDGLDDGVGGTWRISQHATIRVTLPLPPYVRIKGDPTATTVTVNRGVPSTLNTPALEDEFMYDLRHDSLEAQALGAIRDHAQNTVEPTPLQLELIAGFQRQAPRFFSSGALRRFAGGGPPPALPRGVTESERRGRLMFIDAPFTPGSTAGICALCHSGPMLNISNGPLSDVLGNPGFRFRDVTALVSEINAIGNPPITFLVDTDGQGTIVEVTTPDPGELLSASRLPPPFVFPRAFFANFFKINSLWGVKNTAPYFHDNSAKTLKDVADHYQIFFRGNPFGLAVELTEQDKADMVAFLRLL